MSGRRKILETIQSSFNESTKSTGVTPADIIQYSPASLITLLYKSGRIARYRVAVTMLFIGINFASTMYVVMHRAFHIWNRGVSQSKSRVAKVLDTDAEPAGSGRVMNKDLSGSSTPTPC